jgi:FKBP-type peptidyl-prolyl cis-trans isomerase (trigger factor)
MTMYLDIFPEVEILNTDWEKEKLAHIHPMIGEEEIDQAVMNIKKNFAEYKDVEEVTLDSISKIAMEFIDADGKVLETGHNYVGEQEFAEGDFYHKTFLNKKRGESRELPYKEKDLPAVYHYKKTEGTPKHIKLTVQDCKKVVLPELTEAMMLQLFGKESTVKNEAQLRDFIRDTLAQQKFEADLVKSIEDLLQKVKTQSMQVVVPRTLIEEEFSTRMKSLQERFGGQEKLTGYFQQMGDEKGKAFLDDIKRAAKESLEKFFILQKMVEALKIDINREKPEALEVERKLYEKLGEDHDHGHHHDHDHHTHHEEEKAEKKAPAKKKK